MIAAVVLGGISALGGRELSSEVYWELFGGYYKNGMVLLNVPALSEGLVIGALFIICIS